MEMFSSRSGQPLVAVVTGGAGGIGASTCRRLAESGMRVICADVDDETGSQVARQLQVEGLATEYRSLDVGSEEAWLEFREWLLECYGPPMVLVNNAGIDVVRDIFNTTLEDWDRLFRVNSTAMFLGSRTFAKDMHALAESEGRFASIVNMSSICGLIGVAFQTAYCATKGSVRLFTKALALECSALGLKVRVNSIHPGTVDTAFAAQCLKELGEVGFAPSPDEARAAIAGAHPIGHMASSEEIADAIVFLASDASRFMTGSELVVDGGYTAQ